MRQTWGQPNPKTYTPPREKTRMKTVRTDTVGKLRSQADKLFSRFIKKKYGVKCYTCGLERANECGHYMKRDNDATRWDEDNARPQGFVCNRIKDGNNDEFRKRLVAEIGEYRVAEVERKARLTEKFNASDLQEIISKYS